ncbi:MAG: BatD family protein [Armatimonadetes bacterium]|nr:BatD family protein [Armatimonadota bacterium]MDW8122250.1 hypothetical protein [Armatimonadota bacterium]
MRSSGWAQTLVLCLSLSLVAGSLCESQELRASAHPSVCTIGDPITYRVALFAPESARVILPKISRFGEFEILKTWPIQTQKGAMPGTKVTVFQWDVALYRTGKGSIPPLTVTCEMEGKTTLVRSNPVEIQVIPIAPPNAKDPRPIKPPMAYPLSARSVAIVTLIALLSLTALALGVRGLLALGGWALSQWRRWTAPLPLPPDQLALQSISRARQLYQDGQVERAFILLSYALRRYCEQRFEVPALETPTDQLLQVIGKRLRADQESVLAFVLDISDLAKFARYLPTETEASKMFSDSEELVRSTSPIPEPVRGSTPA